MPINLYPYKLASVNKSIVWGGGKLYASYGKTPPCEGSNIAESWELCVHANGVNYIANGEYEGELLSAILEECENSIIAPSYSKNAAFPILVKLIDACERLSVQVHPDDEYAAEHGEPYGKTEMWYVVEADEGAQLVYGLSHDMTREELSDAIASGNLEEHLNFADVKAGDVFFIPAGTIHAIGKGILIAEIQQNSDTTYRVFDYNRLPARQLHIEQAVEVADTTKAVQIVPMVATLIADCKYFRVEKAVKDFASSAANGFNHLLCVHGSGVIKCGGEIYEIAKGDSYLIPAGILGYSIEGDFEILVTRI